MKRQPTQAAITAKAIRSELKRHFPEITFRVTSSNFAGGDAVDIHWTDGPTTYQVDRIVKPYQYGHFDGMVDIYEYSNNRHDLPAQAKYVQTSRAMSDQSKREIVGYLNATMADYALGLAVNKYGYLEYTNDLPNPWGGGMQSHEVARIFQKLDYRDPRSRDLLNLTVDERCDLYNNREGLTERPAHYDVLDEVRALTGA